MKKQIQSTIRFFLAVAVLVLGNTSLLAAGDLQPFANAIYIPSKANDGDSFMVAAGGKTIHLRLYFVDCPESSISARYDARRVREQARYFGLPDAIRAVDFGKRAAEFVRSLLAEPFTVHTAFANAPGRSAIGRIYGFVTTADGDDLASLLVQKGLARAHGVGRRTPDGISQEEMRARHNDFETSAMLKRVGIWADSNPDRIAELRALERSEAENLKALERRFSETQIESGTLNLNTATRQELQLIKGIGPVMAEKIVNGRPYQTVDELREVDGIGPKRFEEFSQYFVIEPEPNQPDPPADPAP